MIDARKILLAAAYVARVSLTRLSTFSKASDLFLYGGTLLPRPSLVRAMA